MLAGDVPGQETWANADLLPFDIWETIVSKFALNAHNSCEEKVSENTARTMSAILASP